VNRSGRILLLALTVALSVACDERGGQSTGGQRTAREEPAKAATGIEKERASIPEPAPVSHAGFRYQAILWGRVRNLPQNGGYVAAIDEKTGKEQWLVKIYDAPPSDGKEQDKLDIFITHIELDSDPRYLLVTNERGAVFRLDLQTRAVTAVPKR
jgi:hypothetical protein